MIAPRPQKQTPREEREAYKIATARDQDRCQRCLRDCGPTARDHRQNRRTGNTVASNLQVLGLRCHIWKTEHPKDALAEGWSVPSWADPAEWPARRWRKTSVGTVAPGWCLYDDEGDVLWISDDDARRLIEEGKAA